MKYVLSLVAISVLALTGCQVEDPEDLDEGANEEVGEAEQAFCPAITMPVVDVAETLVYGDPSFGFVNETARPADPYYDPDNFVYEVTSNVGGDAAFMIDTDAEDLTAANCSSVTITASFWTHDSSTGCWSLWGTTVETGYWNGYNCELMAGGPTLPSPIDKVRMSGRSKMGTTFRRITGEVWYFGAP